MILCMLLETTKEKKKKKGGGLSSSLSWDKGLQRSQRQVSPEREKYVSFKCCGNIQELLLSSVGFCLL